jgi:glucokinase
MILAGDIGGTKTILALFNLQGEVITERTYASQQYASLNEIVRQFLATVTDQPKHVCFGVAGPVQQGRAQPTNLPWIVDADELAAELGLSIVHVINDLEATAHGITTLSDADFLTLNPGRPNARGNAAVIAAGTGLGEAGLYWDGEKHHPFACEGGHADFAPSNEFQIALLEYLMSRFDHVSWERVLSGSGIYNLYQFLRDTGLDEEPEWLAERLRADDPATAITQAALVEKCVLCSCTLDLFVSLYGSAAGNLALKFMATGGVFIGGGIAPRILSFMEMSNFMTAFRAKGRMGLLLESMPVHVILNPKTALLGAARYATELSIQR